MLDKICVRGEYYCIILLEKGKSLMKSPIWIINSALLLLLFIILSYIFFTKVHVPSTVSLRPQTFESSTDKDYKPLSQGFLKTIYEDNDLFGTYIPQRIEPISSQQIKAVPPPNPPAMRPNTPLPTPIVNFMDPLKITLTGIIMSSNESENRVIIADNATKEEKLYKMGDKISDAFILRIFKNKILLLRSNGQQETLFINPEEAHAEIKALQESSWQDVIQKETNFTFMIDPIAFGLRVRGLPQLIEMLDLTTVFSKGRSVGTRIGKIEPKSLGYALGFEPGDIIVNINGITPTTTANRIAIYNQLLSISLGAKVTVETVRKKKRIKLNYTIASLMQKTMLQPLNPIQSDELDRVAPQSSMINLQKPLDLIEQKSAIINQKQNMNSTIGTIKKNDKQAMKKFGSRKSFLQSIPQ